MSDQNVKMGYSMDYQLLKMLQLKYNFSSRFNDEHGNWGLIDQTGHWNGSVGNVLNQVMFKFKTLKTNKI